MIGYLYALCAAVLFAARGGLNKKLIVDFDGICSNQKPAQGAGSNNKETQQKTDQKTDERRIIIWSITIIQLLLHGVGLIIFGIPQVDDQYWFLLIVFNFPVYLIKQFLMIKELQTSQLSRVGPLMTVSPLFATLFSWTCLHEIPNIWGLYGALNTTSRNYYSQRK